MPGTANYPGGGAGTFVYPLATDPFSPTTDMQTLANNIDTTIGQNVMYWQYAEAQTDSGTVSGSAKTYRMLSYGTAPELVTSNWMTNRGSNLIVDSSTRTGVRWGTDYILSTAFIASGTATSAAALSFSSIPQSYSSLMLHVSVLATGTSTANNVITLTTTILNVAGSLSATIQRTDGIKSGYINTVAGVYFSSAAGTTTSGALEILIPGYSKGIVTSAAQGTGGGTVMYKPFLYKSVNSEGEVQSGAGKFYFATASSNWGAHLVTNIGYSVTAGTAIVRLYGLK